MNHLDELQIVRRRLNRMNYHAMKDANLEFQEAIGWTDQYGEFWFYAANSILGRNPNLKDKCANWPNLVSLHEELSEDPIGYCSKHDQQFDPAGCCGECEQDGYDPEDA